jgi:hypothetical protein
MLSSNALPLCFDQQIPKDSNKSLMNTLSRINSVPIERIKVYRIAKNRMLSRMMAPTFKVTLDRIELYNVAWIAALTHERAAALVMFDERHTPPKDSIHNREDENSYSWGRISGHNVVIA